MPHRTHTTTADTQQLNQLAHACKLPRTAPPTSPTQTQPPLPPPNQVNEGSGRCLVIAVLVHCVGIAVARAYMPDATLVDWVKIGIDMARPAKAEH